MSIEYSRLWGHKTRPRTDVRSLVRNTSGPKQVVALAILQLVFLAAWGCGSGSSDGSGGPTLSSEFVMPVERLPKALKRPGVVLLSVQGHGEISNPGFVNHAVPVDETEIRVFSETPGAFTNLSAWAEMFGALGITSKSEVILYDDGEMKFASRVRFLLYYFGAHRTFIVNGGYNAMKPLIASGKLTETPPGTPSAVTFDATIQNNPIHLIDRQDVLAVLGDPAVTLLDVRTVGEFDGCVLLPPVTRGGHIPGARNLPVENILTPQSNAPELSFLDSPPTCDRFFEPLDWVLMIESSSTATMGRNHHWRPRR